MFDGGQNLDYNNPGHPGRSIRRNRKRSSQLDLNKQLSPIVRKMKMYVMDKLITTKNAGQLFFNACKASNAESALNYTAPDNTTPEHRFNIKIKTLFLAVGTGPSKKQAQNTAHLNAVNRLKHSSVEDICCIISTPGKSATAARYAVAVDAVSHKIVIEPDPTRPLSAFVISENHRGANRRAKKALHILRISAYFSQMNMRTVESEVGNLQKVTIFMQDTRVGVGLGPTKLIALTNASGDALFNNFYRNCPLLQIYEEDYTHTWINWNNVKYLANEMQNIGGHSLLPKQDILKHSFVVALNKLVDSHDWSEVNSELAFGPGMTEDVTISLSNIAKERNMNLFVRKNNRFGIFYILQRYYDPMDIVNYLKKNAGYQGKYRLVPKSEIPEIECELWEPAPANLDDNKVSEDVPNPPDSNAPKRQKMMSDQFDREPMQTPWAGDRGFGRMPPPPNNEGFEQSRWNNNRDFGPMSQNNIEERNQPPWNDRMAGPNGREGRETSRPNFGGMQNLERERQFHGQMNPGLSDSYGNECNFNQNQRFGNDERRFNNMYDDGWQNFNQEREFNSQFCDGNRDQQHRTYGNNFDKPTCEPDNRNYNQFMGPNRRDYDNVSGGDGNRFYSQGPNYDDQRFNDEPQFSFMDHRNNPMNPNMMDANRMQNSGPWNDMQNSRNDNRSMFPPNNVGRPQGNMMMQQNRMGANGNFNQNSGSGVRYLPHKLAHTNLHENVRNILEGAKNMGMPGGLKRRRRVRTRGKKKPKAPNMSQNE